MTVSTPTVVTLLDDVYERIQSPAQVAPALDMLVAGLQVLKERSAADDWLRNMQRCRAHPLQDVLFEDPLTKRAFDKPRGYAGDAVMIDFLYGDPAVQQLVAQSSELGRHMLETFRQWPMSCAIRGRRRYVASAIDRVARELPKPRLLSVACGHLREAGLSRAIQDSQIDEVVALDQDEESLAVVQNTYGACRITCVQEGVETLLDDTLQLGTFDMIYSTGLFDYLSQRSAQRLTSALFKLLRSGGRLLIANVLSGIPEAGYMEAHMDWKLICRDAEEMRNIALRIPESEAVSRLFTDRYSRVIFLEIRRKGT